MQSAPTQSIQLSRHPFCPYYYNRDHDNIKSFIIAADSDYEEVLVMASDGLWVNIH
jgi:serine/threonine protein phosphatase PrpC